MGKRSTPNECNPTRSSHPANMSCICTPLPLPIPRRNLSYPCARSMGGVLWQAAASLPPIRIATHVSAQMTHPKPNPCRAGANPLDEPINSRKPSMIHLLSSPVPPRPAATTILEVSVEQRPIRVRITSPPFFRIGLAFHDICKFRATDQAMHKKIL